MKAFEDNNLLNTYKVTFKIDGSADVVKTVISGQNAIAPEDVKKAYDDTNHYKFIGWDKEFTNVTSDLTVTAEFEAIKHTYATTYKDVTYHIDACACGYSKDVEHTETSEVTTKASCSANGVRTYTCSVCSGTRTEVIKKREHHVVDTTVAVDPTCSATGTMNQKCDNAETGEYEACGYTTTRVMDKVATAHKAEADYTVIEKATCEADGYKAILCEYCDAEMSRETITKRAHVYTDNGTAEKATCLATGVMNTVCTNVETDTHKACTHESTRVIEMLEHSYTGEYTWSEETKTHSQKCVNGCNKHNPEATACTFDEVVTPATCYDDGYTTYTCSVCKNSYQDDFTSRTHVYVYATGNGTSHNVTCKYNDCNYTATENCSGGTATCTEKAVCEKCKTAWGEKDAENHTGEANVTKNYKQETCKEEGYTGDIHWSCCDALETKGSVVSKLAHTETTREENRNEATCGADGSYDLVTYCSVCSEVIKTEKMTIGATGNHTLGDYIIDSPATCKLPGSKHKECENCNYKTSAEEIPVIAHTETTREENRNEATCGADGSYDLVTYCSVCSEVIKTEKMTIGATGNHTLGDYIIDSPATCKLPGSKHKECKDCDYKTSAEEIPVIAHTEATRKENVVNATCETDGSYDLVTYCSACNEVIKTEHKTITATGIHNEATRKENVIEATCGKDGSYDLVTYCSVCKKDIKRETITVTASTDSCEFTFKYVSPTCVKDGYSCNACVNCGREINLTIHKAFEHNFAGETTIIEATCTQEGEKRVKCTRCDETKIVEKTGTLNHNYILLSEAVAPTCETPGKSESKACVMCGQKNKVEVYEALGHSDGDSDGKCDRCSALVYNSGKYCTCMCHSDSFFMKIIYKIASFFWKLFKINHSCDCGFEHY